MTKESNRLRTLFWEATLRCNAGCPFCGSRCDARSPAPEADAAAVVKAFASIASAYDPHEIMVNVTGGEPLLRKDLFSVMEQVHQMGFPWGIVTNASLLTEETISSMKRTGMRTITISIDDLFEAHEKLRRLPGAFPGIIKSIRDLDRADFLDSIQITTVVSRENIGNLDKMLCFFSDLPVDSWRLAIVDPIGRCEEQQDMLLRKEELDAFFAFLERHRFHAKPILTTSCSHYLGENDSLYRRHGFHCEAGKSVASILADGSIFVCPNVPRRKDLIQGNINTDDFVTVWETGFLFFRDVEGRKTGPCAACPDWETCKGDSLHTWDFEKKLPKFCYRNYELPKQDRARPAPPPHWRARHSSLRGIRISYGSSSGKSVCFSPTAAQELYYTFHWGERHPANLCEQMVAALGSFSGETAWIEELIPVPLSERGEKTAVFTRELHQFILGETALLNRNLPFCRDSGSIGEKPLQFLGYLHSHPGELLANMSQPDLELYRLLAKETEFPFFMGILNPQKKDLCIYWDSLYAPSNVELFAEAYDAAKWL